MQKDETDAFFSDHQPNMVGFELCSCQPGGNLQAPSVILAGKAWHGMIASKPVHFQLLASPIVGLQSAATSRVSVYEIRRQIGPSFA